MLYRILYYVVRIQKALFGSKKGRRANMRPQHFLELVSEFDCTKIETLTEDSWLDGGWEVWLQVEMACYLRDRAEEGANVQIKREVLYPGTQKRCDFFISYGGDRDETYIELKCQNACASNPPNDITNRFINDIKKQSDSDIKDFPGFCLAVVRCSADDVRTFYSNLQNRLVCWTSCNVLHWANNEIYNLDSTDDWNRFYEDLDGVDDAIFLFAVSP